MGLSHPHSRQRVFPLLPEPKGGGAHSPAGEGLGVSLPTKGEKLSTLSTLWTELSLDKDDAQEEEDDAVAGGGERLDGILDGGVALLAQVLEPVSLHRDPESDHADDPGPVDQLGQ